MTRCAEKPLGIPATILENLKGARGTVWVFDPANRKKIRIVCSVGELRHMAEEYRGPVLATAEPKKGRK